MDLGLAGKAAIVNGASQGIGYAIAHLLAEEGARVAVTARRTPALDRAAEQIRNETDAEVIAVQGDVRNPADCERIVTEAVAGFGRLDILVNNDGAPPLGAALDFDDSVWLKAIAQNLLSVVRMSGRRGRCALARETARKIKDRGRPTRSSAGRSTG
jgi:3-oxoacyl-[acyl-carrier protein] reductase